MEANRLERYYAPQNVPSGNTATMDQLGPSDGECGRCASIASIPLLSSSSEGNSHESAKRYPWVTEKASFLTGRSDAITYLIQVECLGLQDESIATISPPPKLLPYREPEPGLGRGVFSPKYHRKVLFSQPVNFKTSDLPRWKPKVVIDRRTLER